MLEVVQQGRELARAALAGMTAVSGEPDAGRSRGALLRLEPELHDLAAQLSGHRERLCKLAELRHQQERLTDSVHRRLALLGASWTAERIGQVARPELLAEHARTVRRELGELSGNEATAAALLEEAEAVLREVVSEGDIISGEALAPAAGEGGRRAETGPALRWGIGPGSRAAAGLCASYANDGRARRGQGILVGSGEGSSGAGRPPMDVSGRGSWR